MDKNTYNQELNEKNEKDIEVITGDGENLNISPVYNHVKVDKPDINRKKDKKIIIPKSNNNS